MHPDVSRRRVFCPALRLHHLPRFPHYIFAPSFDFTKFVARKRYGCCEKQSGRTVDRYQMINDRFARKDERLNRDRSTRARITWYRVTWRFACALRGRCARFFFCEQTRRATARLHNSPCSVNMRVIVIGQGHTATPMTTMMTTII